ncbi:hypothetical protein [Marivirga sp.]|uniref:hypothetical protein n=1 Tax=Marivirga sp. TaxID=2018662 RepID=UPI003DA7A667
MSLDNEKLKEYNEIEVQSLARRDELGTKGFDEVISTLSELKSMIDEMVEISQSVQLPDQIDKQIDGFISTFISFSNQIGKYDLDSDGRNNFGQRAKIIQNINQYYSQALSGTSNNNFLNVYNTAKNFNLKGIQNERQEVAKIKKDLQKSKLDFDETIKLLRNKAGEKTANDYAEIFENQSTRHSNFSISNQFPYIRLGAAQIWLFFGIISVFILVFVVYLLSNEKLPTTEIITLKGVNGEYQQVQYLISNIVSRILVISICVFLIGFSFKQHSVNRHLFTINKHRQNALESYQLFIKSIDPDDRQVRHQLIIEVAKAIYEQNQTGYISDKSNSPSSNGIIELTKYINQK